MEMAEPGIFEWKIFLEMISEKSIITPTTKKATINPYESIT
jgi:hypothetical protein